jgi:tetratricopeptide (TPR) repeat protein
VRIFLAGVLTVIVATAAPAQSPIVAEVHAWTTRYHEDPTRIDQARAELARVVKVDPHVDDLVALAQVCFIWGDIRARSPDEKLDAYDQGRQAARRATELAPRNVLAHFWLGTNTARWGQTKGLRALFVLPTIRREIATVLDLDPKFAPVYSLAGYVDFEVPSALGGDVDRAERMFRTGLGLDPRFTGMRVGLARTLIKKGRVAEARRELQAVLDERAPANLADWTMKDSRRARELLDSLQGRS